MGECVVYSPTLHELRRWGPTYPCLVVQFYDCSMGSRSSGGSEDELKEVERPGHVNVIIVLNILVNLIKASDTPGGSSRYLSCLLTIGLLRAAC